MYRYPSTHPPFQTPIPTQKTELKFLCLGFMRNKHLDWLPTQFFQTETLPLQPINNTNIFFTYTYTDAPQNNYT